MIYRDLWTTPKTCIFCNEERREIHFKRAYPDYFSDMCVDCYRLYKRKSKLGRLIDSAHQRSHDRGISFNLSESDLEMPERCPVLGIELKHGIGRKDWQPSLDRLDNGKGYVPGNVFVISWRANRIKNDGTAEEHEKIAAWIRSMEAAQESDSLSTASEHGEGKQGMARVSTTLQCFAAYPEIAPASLGENMPCLATV